MNFCNSLEGTDQQITYLKWILIELEHCGEYTDPILKLGYKKYLSDIESIEVEDDCYIAPEYGDYKDFPKTIQREIDYKEKKLKLLEQYKKSGSGVETIDRDQNKTDHSSIPNPLLILKEQLKILLTMLSLAENAIVDNICTQNINEIYDNITSGSGSVPHDPASRINFIGFKNGIWGTYKLLYNYLTTLTKNDKGPILNDIGYMIFFERFCLFQKDYKTQMKVKNGCRHVKSIENDDLREKRLRDIVFQTINSER